MIRLPAFQHFQFDDGETATVFQDDRRFWVFYAIPGFPRVRIDQNENPVFMMVKYNLSDESREADPTLPRGGGYLVFDSELKLSNDNQETVVNALQDYVDDRWNKLKNRPPSKGKTLELQATFNDQIGSHWGGTGHEGGPRASGTTHTDMSLTIPGTGFTPPTGDPPKVQLGEPLWKSGKVTMTAPTAPGLVNGMIGERPASLIGNNVAAFSIDLTPDGAMFMEQTLVAPGGAGATDLTPIQVVYELTMLAKLPPASMYLKFNSAQVYHAVQELFHEHNNCSDDYFTSENMMTTAVESGLIQVKIDMGGVTDDDLQQMLMQQAMNTTQQLLTQKFADKERKPLEEWADSDLAESSREVYRLKRQSEVEMIDFEQTITLDTTTEFTIAPQATMQAFFRKQQDMAPFVRTVNTNNDPFFKTLGLSARAFAKWQEDGVAFVELEIKYSHSGETKTQTFTFTPADNEPKKWDPALIDGKRDYEYRWRVGFQGRDAGDWSKWEKSTSRNLNVAVETPGKLNVEVTGVGLDFNHVLDAALVHLRYEDRRHDVPMAGQSILLSPDRNSGNWTRQLFAPWENPVEYRVEYLLKSGTVIDQSWTKTDGPTQNILIKRPKVDVLDLTLIPAGNWADVIQSVLSLKYIDGDYAADEQFNFRKSDEFKEWAVLLRNSSQRKFQYRILTTFKNGDTQETAWLEREGDQALPVTVAGPPRLDVAVTGAVLDYASTPLVKVDLEYKDPDGQGDIQSYSLQKPDDVHKWSVPLRQNGPRAYRYMLTYFPIEGDPVERAWVDTETELIVVPRYSIPKVGAKVLPTLQDFTKTPGVEVGFSYDHAQSGTHLDHTLIFTDKTPQEWFAPIPDDAPKEYTMATTWFFADGTQRSSEIKLEKPAVLLPPPPAGGA
ncbi:MAG: hypothetical protein AB7I44_19680 [Hyphomicrobiaceae bacterium]